MGNGFFRAEAVDSSKTRITSELELKAHGKGAFAFNGAMEAFVPKMTKRLTEAIANNLAGNYH
ncbi:hypothetical protein ABDI27_08315 [Bacillus mycoides]|uniref:hypothetical protein n=1 Tax=Bacillus mycoides TaxID=1405 RepID=UPI003D192F70|nr:hypothetical protein [Bacillus mycoides]